MGRAVEAEGDDVAGLRQVARLGQFLQRALVIGQIPRQPLLARAGRRDAGANYEAVDEAAGGIQAAIQVDSSDQRFEAVHQ